MTDSTHALADEREKVARIIDADCFALPHINLYRERYKRAYAKADAILAALRRPIEPVEAGEPTEAMIEAGARELWNDRDARMGGPWDSRDPREVCVIQTKATMRAALRAALSTSPAPAEDDDCSCGGGDISGHDNLCPYRNLSTSPDPKQSMQDGGQG